MLGGNFCVDNLYEHDSVKKEAECVMLSVEGESERG